MKDMNNKNETTSSTLQISGMSCAVCANRIEKGLSSLPGIEKAGVNFAVEKASIVYDQRKVSLKEIAAKIEDLGYRVIKDKVELKITGMSCAACSTRIEKALNKMSGVYSAVVNLAMEKATVELNPSAINVGDIKAKIEGLGYGAHDAIDAVEVDKEKEVRQAEVAHQRFRLILSIVFSIPLLLAMMLHLMGAMGTLSQILLNPYLQ